MSIRHRIPDLDPQQKKSNSLHEGAVNMSFFTQVTAVDADGDAVVYRLTRPPGPFVVVPQTGEIILTENPQVYLLYSFEAQEAIHQGFNF